MRRMSDPSRRRVLAGLGLAASSGLWNGNGALADDVPKPQPYSFDILRAEAKALAGGPYVNLSDDLPRVLGRMDYDAWRDIRFRPDRAFLAESGTYRLQLFHRGFLYRAPVTINLLRDGFRMPIPYAPDLFDLGGNKFSEPFPLDLGFAGFRLHYPLNQANAGDELISFLGASYFRLLSRGQTYGISARGLAVNAGVPGEPEEFPAFRSFVIHPPDGERIMIDALMDSPSLAAAFRFQLAPGEPTIIEVEAEVFARNEIKRLGIAPLTSMFYYGENERRPTEDFRPELHDSDGLLMCSGSGEWLWRPLRNPASVLLSSFVDRDPKGFGLVQRDRSFSHYQDLDLAYHKRPSYWVEPLDAWGEGTVALSELPTGDETNDNVVAYWRPREPLPAGGNLSRRYRLIAQDGTTKLNPGGYAVNTFRTPPRAHGSAEAVEPGTTRFLIDFAGGELASLAQDAIKVEASAANGRILRSFLSSNPEIGGFRAGVDVSAAPGQTVDIRVYLRRGDDALTETWTFPWIAG